MENSTARSQSIEAKLEHLLAQGASPDRALELLVDILIERGPEMSPDKRERSAQLILAVLDQCDTRALTLAARRLAVLDFIPKSLLIALAGKSFAVAEPVLTLSADIPSSELAAVVAVAGPAHLQAIASRADLDQTLTSSLIARGDREAIRTCARNRRANLSRTSFDDLVTMADEDASLREALCYRHDIPDSVVPRFWPGCADSEKARLLVSGFSNDAAKAATDAEAEPPEEPLDEEEAIKIDRQVAEIILQYSDISSISRTSQKLAERAGIDEGIAFDLVCGSYERGVVLLARAANVDEWTFLQLICARMKLTSATTAPHRALKSFREYPRDEAKKVLLEVIALREAESFAAKKSKANEKKRTRVA